MSDITIPPEALEKAAKKLSIEDGYDETWWDACVSRFGSDWGLLERYRTKARTACLAMLRSWPGVEIIPVAGTWPPFISLPLPKERRNGEG